MARLAELTTRSKGSHEWRPHTKKKEKKGGPLIVDEKMKRLRFKKTRGLARAAAPVTASLLLMIQYVPVGH